MTDDGAMRKTVGLLLALLAAVAVLAGCTGDGTGGGTGGGTQQRVEVTLHGDSVTPNGDRIRVKVGVPVVFEIHADKPGEIHVHSTPEQQLSYPAGDSTRKVTIDKPGIVDVESHALDKTIVQLQAG